MPPPPKISVVLPVHNEAANITALLAETAAVFDSVIRQRYEIIVVDDASSDRTIGEVGNYKAAVALSHRSETLLTDIAFIALTVRGGQAKALMRGMRAAQGELIVTMDADLQYDPADLPILLEKMNSCDMVCGVRTNRSDGTARLICSRVANAFRNMVTSDSLRDGGCVFRIMRRQCLAAVLPLEGHLYGCDFFFHPLFVRKAGYRLGEAEVRHRPRAGGRTNYRLIRGRLIRGIAACLVARKLVSGS